MNKGLHAFTVIQYGFFFFFFFFLSHSSFASFFFFFPPIYSGVHLSACGIKKKKYSQLNPSLPYFPILCFVYPTFACRTLFSYLYLSVSLNQFFDKYWIIKLYSWFKAREKKKKKSERGVTLTLE